MYDDSFTISSQSYTSVLSILHASFISVVPNQPLKSSIAPHATLSGLVRGIADAVSVLTSLPTSSLPNSAVHKDEAKQVPIDIECFYRQYSPAFGFYFFFLLGSKNSSVF